MGSKPKAPKIEPPPPVAPTPVMRDEGVASAMEGARRRPSRGRASTILTDLGGGSAGRTLLG
jgi:hypothetical protein